jgi:hypothetical protein
VIFPSTYDLRSKDVALEFGWYRTGVGKDLLHSLLEKSFIMNFATLGEKYRLEGGVVTCRIPTMIMIPDVTR